jgi:hypothetical protein
MDLMLKARAIQSIISTNWYCEGYSLDLTMVAPTLLRIGGVTLAETIDPSGHRTPTSNLGSPLIKARNQPIDENGGHCRLDWDS